MNILFVVLLANILIMFCDETKVDLKKSGDIRNFHIIRFSTRSRDFEACSNLLK